MRLDDSKSLPVSEIKYRAAITFSEEAAKALQLVVGLLSLFNG